MKPVGKSERLGRALNEVLWTWGNKKGAKKPLRRTAKQFSQDLQVSCKTSWL